MQRMPMCGTVFTAVALLIAATSSQTASASPTIQLLYSGTDSNAKRFQGCVQYDQAKPRDSLHFFNYRDATYHHAACFITETGLSGSVSEPEPYTINTSANKNFGIEVITTVNGYTLYITFYTYISFTPTAPLPLCQSGGVFKNAGTFQVFDSGGTQRFSGNIDSVQCSQPTGSNPTCPQCALVMAEPDMRHRVEHHALAAPVPCARCLTRVRRARVAVSRGYFPGVRAEIVVGDRASGAFRPESDFALSTPGTEAGDERCQRGRERPLRPSIDLSLARTGSSIGSRLRAPR